MNPFAEQEAWEEHQIGNIIYLLFISIVLHYHQAISIGILMTF
jgi:hypothetical protein